MKYKELGCHVEEVRRRVTPELLECEVNSLMSEGEDIGGGVNAFRLVRRLLGVPSMNDVETGWAYVRLKPALRTALEQIPSLVYLEGD